MATMIEARCDPGHPRIEAGQAGIERRVLSLKCVSPLVHQVIQWPTRAELSMPLNASKSYNAKVEALLQRLQERPVPPRAAEPQAFVRDDHIEHHFTSADLLGDVVTTHTSVEGVVIGNSFVHDGREVALVEDAWKELVRISESVQSAPDYRNVVSLETIQKVLFEWVKDKYKGRTEMSPLALLSERCEATIKDVEVWVPVAYTRIEGELEFGNVTFKTISKVMIDHWEEVFNEKLPEKRDSLPEYFRRFRREWQGLAAATMCLRAEPKRAYEVGQREADRSAALLRCLSAVNAFPLNRSYLAPLGQESMRSFQRFLTEDGLLVNNEEGAEGYEQPDVVLTQRQIAELKVLGLDRLHALLKTPKRSRFQEDVLSALLLYSRSSLYVSPGDKLTYVLAPLESLLLDNSVDPEELGVRMAMLSNADLEGSKSIVHNTRAAYRLRSRFVRGEASQDEIDILREFLFRAWEVMIRIIGLFDQFETRRDFMNCLEELKLSGGLPGEVS